MNRNYLFGALGAALLITAGPAHAGAGAIGAAQQERGGRQEGGRNDRSRDQPQQNFRDSGNRNGGGQWQGRQGDGPRGPQAPDRGPGGGRQGGGAPQQVQRNDGDQRRWVGNDNNRREEQRRWVGNDNNRREEQRRGVGNDNNRRWEGDRNYGSNRNWSNNRGWNDRYRDNRQRRSYAALPYGGYFGPSYGSIVSRYYGRNYIYYGSRSWSSWSRPYRIGYALPPAVYCREIPYDLYYDLPPPPYGYDYALCGRDILLVGLDSGIVIDAILGWY